MDQRQTFDDLPGLLAIVSGLYQKKQKASLLVDIDGLTRIEGEPTAIQQNEDISKSFITIDNKAAILLNQIIAVNGIFRSDYSEC